MPVGVMMGQMSALEETYWISYNQMNPIGDYRADVRNAQLLNLLYSIHAGKQAPKKTLTDWMPFFRKRVKPDENITTNVRTLFGNIIKHQDK